MEPAATPGMPITHVSCWDSPLHPGVSPQGEDGVRTHTQMRGYSSTTCRGCTCYFQLKSSGLTSSALKGFLVKPPSQGGFWNYQTKAFIMLLKRSGVCQGFGGDVCTKCGVIFLSFGIMALWGSGQFSSVAQSCPTLSNPMDRSTPGLPVHHQLPKFTQTHVHRVGDAIQPSHPLSSPAPPAFNLSQHQGLFQ